MIKLKNLILLPVRNRFLSISTILHLLLLFVVSQISIQKPIENISIEVLQRPAQPISTKLKVKSQSTASLQTKKINPFLFKSYLENTSTIADSANKSPHSNYGGNTEWKESYFYLSDGMTDYNDISTPDVHFLQSFWQQVDTNIENNPFLSEYGHVGTIFFQFNLNEKGELINESLKVSSMDSVLKVIAIRAIRKPPVSGKLSCKLNNQMGCGIG